MLEELHISKDLNLRFLLFLIPMFVFKLPNFIEEHYRSTEYFSVNNQWIPTLSIAQTKLHEVRNILRC